MLKILPKALIVAAAAVAATFAYAESGKPADADAAPKFKKLGQTSGFEGREDELGRAMSTAIKTLQHSRPYQHEMNDALVKMTLGHIQFAKDNGLLKEVVEQDIEVTSPMMNRVAKQIAATGDSDLALKAIFEQTTCFYQLVDETIREPGKITYKSPFAGVLEQTQRLGQYDLTEQEVFEVWTRPRYEGYAKILGVDLEVSDWNEDGMITISVAPIS